MGVIQKYGVKYPFTTDNEEGYFLDLNNTLADGIKSQVLHVILTPKGQKLRDPEFGTDLIKYIFSTKDDISFNDIKLEITNQITKYVPQVEFRDISIYSSEENEHGIIITVEYGVKNGNKTEVTTVAVKL
jgi:phage baseplate assembly protein W